MNTARRVEVWPVDRLRPRPTNPRTHSPEQVAKLAASLAEFGFTQPILVEPDGGVVAGHGRLLAAKELGLAEVPVIPLEGLTPEQIRAYVIADNRLALDAGWDEELLAAELAELCAGDTDLGALTGFTDDELADLLDRSLALVEQPQPARPATGAREYGAGDFSEFDHRCPKCGFEFDDA